MYYNLQDSFLTEFKIFFKNSITVSTFLYLYICLCAGRILQFHMANMLARCTHLNEFPDLFFRSHLHPCTVEPRYNEVLGTMKITLLYQVSHIRVQKQRNIKSWDQQNYLVIRGFCYIRPLYNKVPLYTHLHLYIVTIYEIQFSIQLFVLNNVFFKQIWCMFLCTLFEIKF